MKVFSYDSDIQAFGIKDDEKFKIILVGVLNVNIASNKAIVYMQNGMYEYTMLDNNTGEYVFKNITL